MQKHSPLSSQLFWWFFWVQYWICLCFMCCQMISGSLGQALLCSSSSSDENLCCGTLFWSSSLCVPLIVTTAHQSHVFTGFNISNYLIKIKPNMISPDISGSRARSYNHIAPAAGLFSTSRGVVMVTGCKETLCALCTDSDTLLCKHKPAATFVYSIC